MTPHVAALLSQAAGMLRANRPADAVIPLREAARWQPGDAAILHDLGLACLACGDITEAVAALRQAVAARPRFADAHLRLGIALEAEGAPNAALAAYRRAADITPRFADALYRAGDLLETLGCMVEAAQSFRRAAAAAPDTTLGRIATAKALLAENRDPEAEPVLRMALALDPRNALALELLGTLLADAGRFEEAQVFLARAIDQSPLRAGSYYELVRCRRIGPADTALIARMQAALNVPGLETAQRARVHLALGKAADDLADHETAMRHFDAAEQVRNTLLRFDLAGFEARIDRIIAIFSASRLAATNAPNTNRPAPIFIVGMPRSGTTLIEQILSAHHAVQAGGELSFWTERGTAWERAGAAAPDPRFLGKAAAEYAKALRGIAPRAGYVTDKMPLNFQWAGLIHLTLPHATIIHCRRSPLDTALSIHRTHFNPRMAFPTGGAALVGYIRAYQRLSAHWRAVLPPARFIEMEYDALTTAPEAEISRLVAACGLDWDDACLRPEQNARSIKTPSKFQARQPIYQTAIATWQPYAPWLGALRALQGLDLTGG